jgi:hypothetical protein
MVWLYDCGQLAMGLWKVVPSSLDYRHRYLLQAITPEAVDNW